MAAPGKPDVFARIEQDLARGDLGSAHRRLASHVRAKPYDPELLAKLGELSLRMGDQVLAGRELFLSSATGEQVEAAVDAFAQSFGRSPRALAHQLRRLRRDVELPQIVRERLARYQVDVWNPPPPPTQVGSARKRRHSWMELGCVLALLFIVGCVVAEIVRFLVWLAR